MDVVAATSGKDNLDGLWVDAKLIGQHRKEFFCLLLDPFEHEIVGPAHDMIGVEVENQVCPQPALVLHGRGVRLLVVRARVIGVRRDKVPDIIEQFVPAGKPDVPAHVDLGEPRRQQDKTPLPLFDG